VQGDFNENNENNEDEGPSSM